MRSLFIAAVAAIGLAANGVSAETAGQEIPAGKCLLPTTKTLVPLTATIYMPPGTICNTSKQKPLYVPDERVKNTGSFQLGLD